VGLQAPMRCGQQFADADVAGLLVSVEAASVSRPPWRFPGKRMCHAWVVHHCPTASVKARVRRASTPPLPQLCLRIVYVWPARQNPPAWDAAQAAMDRAQKLAMAQQAALADAEDDEDDDEEEDDEDDGARSRGGPGSGLAGLCGGAAMGQRCGVSRAQATRRTAGALCMLRAWLPGRAELGLALRLCRMEPCSQAVPHQAWLPGCAASLQCPLLPLHSCAALEPGCVLYLRPCTRQRALLGRTASR